jgi:hypothetical protein
MALIFQNLLLFCYLSPALQGLQDSMQNIFHTLKLRDVNSKRETNEM